MAFLVEDGSGVVAGAGDVLSYADVALYLSFWQDTGLDGTDLTAIDAAVVQRHLVSATRFLDQLAWNGQPVYHDGQRRTAIPRDAWVVYGSPYYLDGEQIPNDVLPVQVADACCNLAEIERSTGEPLGRARDLSKVVIAKGLGRGAITKKFADGKAPRSYPDAMGLVQGLHGSAASQRPLLLAV